MYSMISITDIAIIRSDTSPMTPVESIFFNASASLVTRETSLPVLPYSKNRWDRLLMWLKKSDLMSAMTRSPSFST